MNAEASNRRTAPARWQGAIFGIHLVAPKRISLVRIGLRAQAPSFHEICHTAMNALRHASDFSVTWRGKATKYRFTLAVNHIDAIQSNYVWFRTMSCDVGVH